MMRLHGVLGLVLLSLAAPAAGQVPSLAQIEALQRQLQAEGGGRTAQPPALRLPNPAETGEDPDLDPALRNKAAEPEEPPPEEPPEPADPRADLSATQRYYEALLGEVLVPFGLSGFVTPGGNDLLLYNALGPEYRLSAGDQLQVVISGLDPVALETEVDRGGKVLLPRLLPISLSGLTVAQAAERLAEAVRVTDASARVSVTVQAARLVPVQMGGMVRHPQILALPAFTPLSLALARAGGLHPDASLRALRVISGAGDHRQVDLYGLLLGDPAFHEPRLSEGDRVHVPAVGPTIGIAGPVPRAGIFELPPGRGSISVAEALEFAGLSFLPNGVPIERVFFTAEGLPTSEVVRDPGATQVAAGEAVRLGLVRSVRQGAVSVVGAVLEPFDMPYREGLRLSHVLRGGAVLADDVDRDLVMIVSRKTLRDTPFRLHALTEVLAGRIDPDLFPGDKVFLPTRSQVDELLLALDGSGEVALGDLEGDVVDNLLIAEPARVYIDGRLAGLVPAGVDIGLVDRVRAAAAEDDLYMNYALLENAGGSLVSRRLPTNWADGQIGEVLWRGQRLFLFTSDFIASIAGRNDSEDAIAVEVDSAAVEFNLDERLERRMLADSRLVLGEVGVPGAYPLAEGVTLYEVLSVAGGLLPNADPTSVELRSYRTDGGALRLRAERVIDTTRLNPATLTLGGLYNIRVPPLRNDAFIGSVDVGGEVVRPGTYTIARGETLADVISRAGGLTRTAYPLGAVLSRRALVEGERAANARLAEQLRQSVITLSQSDREGVAEQIAEVLRFAAELEAAPATGRQVVNVADVRSAQAVLVEDGDRLVIPPRPSNVRVIGAVHSEVATQYREGAGVRDYIEDAGGLTRIADARRAFLILPSGQSRPLDLRGRRELVPVPPGAVIVVPPKIDRLTPLQVTDVLARALGNIASSILAMDVLTSR